MQYRRVVLVKERKERGMHGGCVTPTENEGMTEACTVKLLSEHVQIVHVNSAAPLVTCHSPAKKIRIGLC